MSPRGPAALRPAIVIMIAGLVVLAFTPTALALDERYHTKEEVHAEILALAASYPGIVRVDTLGVTATDGLDVWAVKLCRSTRTNPSSSTTAFTTVRR